MLNSELYRTSVRELCRHFSAPEGVDPGKAFCDYVEENYDRSKRHWAENTFKNEAEKIAAQNALFVFAVGAFAYGRIEAAMDILPNLPESGNIRRLALSLKALLPIPEGLDPLKNSEGMMQWLGANADTVKWNESLGAYE